MPHVLTRENAAPAVQQEPVKAIFKSIGIDEAGQQAQEESCTGGRHKVYGEQHENCTRKQRCEEVLPLDFEALRSVFGPKDAFEVSTHRRTKLARSTKARKGRMSCAWAHAKKVMGYAALRSDLRSQKS